MYYANNPMYGTDFFNADDCECMHLRELRDLANTLERGPTYFPDEYPGILYEGMLHVAVMRSRCKRCKFIWTAHLAVGSHCPDGGNVLTTSAHSHQSPSSASTTAGLRKYSGKPPENANQKRKPQRGRLAKGTEAPSPGGPEDLNSNEAPQLE